MTLAGFTKQQQSEYFRNRGVEFFHQNTAPVLVDARPRPDEDREKKKMAAYH
jgi:hypothetical protein